MEDESPVAAKSRNQDARIGAYPLLS